MQKNQLLEVGFLPILIMFILNRSLRRSFRVISHRKKKKDKNRRTSGDVTLAMADKEGNDETRALRGMLEYIQPYSENVVFYYLIRSLCFV